jgi:hypothetical protein
MRFPHAFADGRDVRQEFSCFAGLGTDGCGFEQPLEATFMAISQALEDGPNASFFREDSLLVLAYVLPEDDCSAADMGIFDLAEELGPLSLRCVSQHHMLHDVERYVEELSSWRPDRSQILVAALIGIPSDGSWRPGDSIEMLQDLVRIDGSHLVPICESDSGFGAFSAPRIVDFAYHFDWYLAPICEPNWRPAMHELAARIMDKIR